MATSANPPPGAFAVGENGGLDPFIASSHDVHRQRYSAFDSQASLYLNGSPAQTKRALQAHLSETTRRLQETSQVGNALVQQRKELEERLKEVENQLEENEVNPELRHKLVELEKELHEVGRLTARAVPPKSRVPSGETDATGGASVYSSEALHSPSKVSVPSRKQRNQQPSRINDIHLATEISTSLLSQLKELQAVLSEKEEALKAADLDRSQLEVEVEGLSQRLRTLDESESRLKDVNWNLETQVREFEVQSKSSTDKEHRLNLNLNAVRSEKAATEREFEELKQLYAKLHQEHSHSSKQHETELSGLRRNVSMGETERGALQRKVEELANQNQELARAVAYRLRSEEQNTGDENSADDGAEEGDTMTPEHSPPPSPSKATPRHGQLESETLKHSLHHAHRMIQQLKNNIHREKTEKIELKRMLQDARDELETNRNSLNGPSSASKRKKNDKDIFKKPARPDRLGALRTGSQEVVLDEDDWEEQEGLLNTPSRRSRPAEAVPGAFPSGFSSAAETSAEDFETANETSDAFETANERDGTTTETDAFQTGAETLDGDSSDDLTETEAGPTSNAPVLRPSPLPMGGHHNAYESTASTSGDEDDDLDIRTPIQSQNSRYKSKLRQAGYRRSTPRLNQDIFLNTPPFAKDSPASFTTNSNNSTPAQGKSLFAELGALSGESEDGSVADGTPSRVNLISPDSSPEVLRRSVLGRSALDSIPTPKPIMVDSGMMTETWSQPTPPQMSMSSILTTDTEPRAVLPQTLRLSTMSAQDTAPKMPSPPLLGMSPHVTQNTEPKLSPLPSLQKSLLSVQNTEPLAPLLQSLQISSLAVQNTEPLEPLPQALRISSVVEQNTEPLAPPHQPLQVSGLSTQDTKPVDVLRPTLGVSSVSSQGTNPVSPTVAKSVTPLLALSSITGEVTDPRVASSPAVALPQSLLVSSVSSQGTEPSEHTSSRSLIGAVDMDQSSTHVDELQKSQTQSLGVSSFSTQMTDPVEGLRPTLSRSMHSQQDTAPIAPPARPIAQFSKFISQATEPVEAAKPSPSALSTISSQSTVPLEVLRPALPQISVISTQSTDPVEAFKPKPSELSTINSQGTAPVEPQRPAPLAVSAHSSQSTEPIEPARRSLPQFSVLKELHTSPVEPSIIPVPENMFSTVTVLQDTQPESPTLPHFLPSPSRPSTANRVPRIDMSFSEIISLETEPFVPSRPVTAHRDVPAMVSSSTGSDPFIHQIPAKSAARNVSTFDNVPLSNRSVHEQSFNSEPKTHDVQIGRQPLAPLSSNSLPSKSSHISMSDEGTQTMVSADQMEKLFALRVSQRHSGTIAIADVEKSISPPASPRRLSGEPQRTPRRPGSSGSMRSRAASPPPLPADHREVIAAASLKTPSIITPPPTTPGAMGPPVMPASAYKKRPQTPSLRTTSVATSPKAEGITPRPRYNSARSDAGRSGATSPITRRSSMSSLVSELDSRFQPNQNPFAQSGFDPNTTDPRMIQAITQTMIGEFLWKYTRKTGSGNMSGTRHRRFFWVHPYTRTLYWSEQDPATAGRAQLKAKSVAILAVEVINDDNPYPPGLHRKSLLIHTPGRDIQFTATTSQRHETWFNALSYLLMRVGDQPGEQNAPTDEIQDEFNPGYRSTSRQTGRSRISMSSYVTRRTSSPHHTSVPTLRPAPTPHQRASSTEPGQESSSGRMSSLSGVFRGSFSSRRSRTSAVTAYSQPERDSRADLMEEMMEQNMNDSDQLVNVRACCDGKHDVGHIHHSAKSGHKQPRASLTASLSSRSHSRASGRQSQNRQRDETEPTSSGA
ncbi:hypothetical protein B0J11DRAFT_441702 [Dendryphion nanum]|uniref:PH domain-containing protein n=1 Tax=Dendryphion nanum TaxID=256645 RepID=A0A9P9DEU7_9PLEO|nr:hypothetical protein B0J11DRAFT_441702 [Dendryphion nanum]